MAGRRPTSAAIKLVTGNPGKRRVRADEPVAVPGWPATPPGLGTVAAAEWVRLARLLAGELRLTPADGPHLLVAAKAYGTALAFEKRARQRGLPHDEWRRFKTGERMQWDAYRKALNDLCLSQGTRARAHTGGRGQSPSKLDGFLRGTAGGKARSSPSSRRA